MNDFTFRNHTKVYFGQGAAPNALPTELSQVGKTVLLAYGQGSIKRNGVYDEMKSLYTPLTADVFREYLERAGGCFHSEIDGNGERLFICGAEPPRPYLGPKSYPTDLK